MPKEIPNKRYTVVGKMRDEKLSYNETTQKYSMTIMGSFNLGTSLSGRRATEEINYYYKLVVHVAQFTGKPVM